MSHPAFPEWRDSKRRCGNCAQFMTVQEAVDAGEGYVAGGYKFHAKCYEEWVNMSNDERTAMYRRAAIAIAQEEEESK